MPLIFRKVYGDVGGKRQVIRTEKISGDAAREYIAKRDAERAKTAEQRTFSNLLKLIFRKKTESVIQEKSIKVARDLGLKIDTEKNEVTLPKGFLDFRPRKDLEQERREAEFKREQLETQRAALNLQRDRELAQGARADLSARGLMGEGVDITPRIEGTLNIFKPGGLFDFSRLF
jgi:hypothetical protein